jgi:hypothetical protein
MTSAGSAAVSQPRDALLLQVKTFHQDHQD